MNTLFAYLSPGTNLDLIPIGLAYVASALKETGRYVSGFNACKFNNPIGELIKTLSEENIDLLCIGDLSANFPTIKHTINMVKRHLPQIKIMLGGGIITAEPELIARHLNIDYGCIGYGEETIYEFAECFENRGNFAEVKGLIFKDEFGNIIITPHRPEPESIDEISFPDLEMFGFAGMEQSLTIIGSRSCMYNCTFCFHPSGHSYKQRSLDNIFSEIDYWRNKHEIRHITYSDELFGSDEKRLYEFCRRIKRIDIGFNLSLRVDIITDEIIEALADSGCRGISYGIESLCQNVLDSMRKNITVQQIESALKITKKYNLPIIGSGIIFGDCVETYEMALESLSWWLKNIHFGLSIGFITAYPGSVLYKNGVKNGRISDRIKFLEQRCPITNLSAMSDMEFLRLRRVVELMRGMEGEPVTGLKIEDTGEEGIFFYADCPSCDTRNYVHYNNVIKDAMIDINFKICNKCGSKIRIAQQYKNNLLENQYFENFDYLDKKIAVWGVSQTTSFRLATVKKMREAVVVVVDRDYHNHKNEFWGFTVQSPDILPMFDFNVLYIGSRNARKKILSTAKTILGTDLDNKELMMID